LKAVSKTSVFERAAKRPEHFGSFRPPSHWQICYSTAQQTTHKRMPVSHRDSA
jgi:hypothetical protein